MSKDNGGSAFPNDGAWANGHPEGGMTIRDYFAAQAIAGLFADRGITGFEYANEAAATAYELADAMLAERAKAGGA